RIDASTPPLLTKWTDSSECVRRSNPGRLVVMSITTMTFAARDFSARRGASDEHTLQRSVRSEQRSLAEKELPPGGVRRIWPMAALLVGHRSTSGYAPASRLAPGQIRRNDRHRSYAHDHLASRSPGFLSIPCWKE